MNTLEDATSPYLLQHKNNPVHWREWSKDVLDEAQRLDRPILLSVGYAACHWCHVMAHESFENAEIAERMNRDFLCVKVDREERPDIDAIYQHALAMLGQQGGWPLTMFLAPDGAPFWGGTYFPPEQRYGRPGLPQVLSHIAELWRTNRNTALSNCQALTNSLERLGRAYPAKNPRISDLRQSAVTMTLEFDTIHGGLGTAPKFPQAPILRFLWQAARSFPDQTLEQRLLHTLRRICQGGIYDHLGGGFARYSVDAFWLVPHFEKMLYDNAQLIELLSLAQARTGDPLFLQRIEETLGWLEREMLTDGGFASAIDADSEGEEGRFYVWTAEEIDAVLGEESALFALAYGVTTSGNWEGRTILNRLHEPGLPEPSLEAELHSMREKLFARRETRPHPMRDDKVLADWNGLAIHSLAAAGRRCGRQDWISLASNVYDRVTAHLGRDDRLAHGWRDGRSLEIGFLDDYAQMMRAAASLHEATNESGYLADIDRWLSVIDKDFSDGSGSYYLHGPGTEELLVRSRNAHDGPTPSANGTLAWVLERIARRTGDPAKLRKARAIVEQFAGMALQAPQAHPSLLTAALALETPQQVVIVGPDDRVRREVLQAIEKHASFNLTSHIFSPDEGAAHTLPPDHPAHGKTASDGRTTAYLCIGPVCREPVHSADELTRLLDESTAARDSSS